MARKTEIRYVNLYTVGSAAYQLDPKPVRKKKEVNLPEPRQRKKAERLELKVDVVSLLGICMAVVLLITMTVGLIQLGKAREEAQQMQDYVNALTARNEELSKAYAEGYDPDEIYEIAIAMGLVPADQVQRVPLQVEKPVVEEKTTVWDSVWTFLTGLFA